MVLLVRAVRPACLRIDDLSRRLRVKDGRPYFVSRTDLVVTNGSKVVEGHSLLHEYRIYHGVSNIAMLSHVTSARLAVFACSTGPAGGRLAGPELAVAPYDKSWKPGMTPPAFLAQDTTGVARSLDQYAGKVVLLDYWATWCGPCMEEVPDMVTLYGELHAKGLEVIGICLDDAKSNGRITSVVKRSGMIWPELWDGKEFESPLARAYKVGAIPFNVIVGRDGKIAAIDVHGSRLRGAVLDALAKR